MPEALKFYDLKSKKSFTSTNYKIISKNRRKMAVTKAPSGAKSVRFV